MNARAGSAPGKLFAILCVTALALTVHVATAPPAEAGPSFSGAFGQGDLYQPYDVVVDRDNPDTVFVVDTRQHRIVKYVGFVRTKIFGQGPPAYANGEHEEGKLFSPLAAALHEGELYVADTDASRISVFNAATGTFVRDFGEAGTAVGQIEWPTGIAIHPTIDRVYVTEQRTARVSVFTTGGEFVKAFGRYGTGDGEFIVPAGVAVSKFGAVYVTDEQNHRVQLFDESGTYMAQFGTQGYEPGQLHFPDEISVDEELNVYVAESSANTNRVQKFKPAGTLAAHELVWELDGRSSSEPGLGYVHGVDVDKNGNVYVANTNDSVIWYFRERPPDLKLFFAGFRGDDVRVSLAYNQAGETCEGTLRSKIVIPGGPTFSPDRRVAFSDVQRNFTINLTEAQFKTLRAAVGKGKVISGESSVRGRCSDGEFVSKTIDYKFRSHHSAG